MKAALQAKLGTSLALTPQLRQAIRLLQLSQLELEAELLASVEANPLLELVESGDGDGESANADEPVAESDEPAADGAEAEGEDSDDLGDEDWSLDDEVGPRSGDAYEDREDNDSAGEPGLHEHLGWQLRMSVHSERDQRLGEAIIDALDDDGYLTESLEALPAALPPGFSASADDFRPILHLVQQFDPIGCGALDLSECLVLQLHALAIDTPGLALARQLAEQHLDALARHREDKLAIELQVTPEALFEATALLKSLDPKPGARFGGGATEYVQPDAIALRQRGVWRVRMARGGNRLRLNTYYQSLIGHCSRDDDAYLRGQLQEARWLLKALENRGETLQRVAEAIVRAQSAFLDHGAEAMRPLTLREVAEQLELHESTISRATTRKYLRTPRGTFEFKYFFRSGVATEHGGAAASTAVQAMIKKLIDAEPRDKPLSDQVLADLLKTSGINVARRTVAKYREGLGLPSSSERGGG